MLLVIKFSLLGRLIFHTNMLEKGINWNDYPTHLKRGSCCIKKEELINVEKSTEEGIIFIATTRNKWVIDTEIPIFTQNKDYINRLVMV